MTRGDAAWLAGLAALFLAWHVPFMARTSAGQDEDFYGVPGITIARGGLPRIPYITSDDPRSACYRADVALYTLPPLSFYLQALVHLALGEGLGQARLASALEGLAAVGIVFALGRLWLDDRRAARLGAMAYLLSRPFVFPATMARPDMAASLFGLASVWLASRDGPAPRRRSVAASGASAGLSLLAHPFGVVAATQVGLRLLVGPTGRTPARRLGDAALFAGAALAVFALWLPLIALHPDLFRAQFLGNVFRPAGPVAIRTPLGVLSAFAFQLRRIGKYLGPPGAALFLLGAAWASIRPHATDGRRALRYHLVASVALLLLFQGRHPALGYLAYPAALASVAVGGLASAAADRIGGRRGVGAGLAAVALLAALLPGAGLRTLLAHLRHRDDPAYDAHALARSIMADIPPGAVTAVGSRYVLDFYLAGRPAIDAFIEPDPQIRLYDVRDRAYQYAVLGRVGLRRYKTRMPRLALLRTYGDPNDRFAPYAMLFRRTEPPDDARRPAYPPPGTRSRRRSVPGGGRPPPGSPARSSGWSRGRGPAGPDRSGP